MGSEPDLTVSTISREGSFFSLDSGNSEYVTACESLPTSLPSINSMTQDEGKSNTLSKNTTTSNSSNTLGSGSGCESLSSEGQCAESGTEEPLQNMDDDTEDEDTDTEFELKADVTKICNDIAEAIPPDTKKKAEINLAIASSSKASLKELRKLATSDGGLLSNTLRKDSWATLLGISKKDIKSLEKTKLPTVGTHVTPEIKRLVKMDVARVLKRFPPGLSDPQQDHLQSHLSKLIISILDKNPEAHYYQGFHDISLTFLLVCISQGSPYPAYLCLDKMINTCLAPFMEKTMEFTHELIHVLFAIIESEDANLYKKIVEDSRCPAAFCLPWVLTWFSHTLPNDHDVFRVYDFVLGCIDQVDPPYLIPIFISASLVLRNADKIKAIRETDIATMHHALASLPSQQDSLEPWLQHSLKLMKSYKGKEHQLVGRAVHIKEYQNKLWDLDNNSNRRSASANNRGVLASMARYIFVKKRWYTLALLVLGAAYLFQTRYGDMQPAVASAIGKYIPHSVKNFYRNYLGDVEFRML